MKYFLKNCISIAYFSQCKPLMMKAEKGVREKWSKMRKYPEGNYL